MSSTSLPNSGHTIIYTHTDEAPALATRSLLPVVNAFTRVAGVQVELRDISLAGRVLATFPEALTPEQRVSDDLAELGGLVHRPEANVIKLPNVSASIPQLKATIEELRGKGYALPDYPDEPSTPQEEDVKARYDKIKGSAVNPVLREGNSDRRAPASVKNYARSHPHKMGAWSKDSKTSVATMGHDDFRSNERSVTFAADDELKVELVATDGSTTVLKDSIPVLAGEIVDATFMSVRNLDAFLAEQMSASDARGVLFSIHLKATMMKVSDPIIFGHAVKTYFADVFAKYGDTFDRIGVNPNDGLADLLTRVGALPDAERAAIEGAINARLQDGPALAMVDSDRGITNLHVPSDIIIDASMPPMIRDSGQMWNAAGEMQDTLAVIPDSSYAGVYAAVVTDCQAHGAFDPSTMGSVPNVGLMAQQAEEYGSHDKTFEIVGRGKVRIVDADGRVIRGKDTISVTGNILRDYLTDLFPIMELGTSAKMLSIVPLMAGGAMFETGAGGSAPKHVQQLVEENHLRWDSLGEFMAIAVSLEDIGFKHHNKKAMILAKTLDEATGKLLDNNKSPSPKAGQLDNRGSHFYLALYWAQALAAQSEDAELRAYFGPLAKTLAENEKKIVDELNAVQGKPVDIGGYYVSIPSKVAPVMRPSPTFNSTIDPLAR
jgi:monomeric isocitrate dehydrogenase